MIYILVGNDIKDKNIFLKRICKKDSFIFDYKDNITKDDLLERASSVSLFGDVPVVLLDSLIKDKKFELSDNDLSKLQSSKSIFIFLEDKLLSSDMKKYSKYSKIEEFNKIEAKQFVKNNIFSIADSFARKDKINTWMLYREALESGSSPEEICGILFWKIKDTLLKGNKFFTKDEIINLSNELVSVYHKAHRGEIDFNISLEQFILSSLGKK